jgi:hypothetical protein
MQKHINYGNLQSNQLYSKPPQGSIFSSVWDLSSNVFPEGLSDESVDIIILVFVLSALHPDEWRTAVANIHRVYITVLCLAEIFTYTLETRR